MNPERHQRRRARNAPIVRLLTTVAALGCSLPGLARSQEPALVMGPGWTGGTHALEIITARRALMLEVEGHMRPVDAFSAGSDIPAEELAGVGATMAAMLRATPHLFPPTTDLFDREAEPPVTFALPAIWEDFPSFYALAEVAVAAAQDLADADGSDESLAAAAALRGACDACHALSLRPYVPEQVSEADRNFDFDSFFEEIEPAPTDGASPTR